MIGGVMSPIFSAAGAEFLQHYQLDLHVRCSPDDLAAQQAFVNSQIAGGNWLDWSSPSAALQLVQATHAATVVGTAEKYEAIVLAGPVVELLDPISLFRPAAPVLVPDGKLVGLIPCLRDNSPESQMFIDIASESLWPYYTAEELREILRDAGWQIEPAVGGFVPVPQFNVVVNRRQLGFKGFSRVFERLAAEGYDLMEVGWGELRFVATLE